VRRADRQIGASVEGVHHSYKGNSQGIRVGERHADEAAFAAVRQSVQHGQSQGVIDVVAHVGIEDDVNLPRGEGSEEEQKGECQNARTESSHMHITEHSITSAANGLADEPGSSGFVGVLCPLCGDVTKRETEGEQTAGARLRARL